jgi:hypothetical protein
MQGGMSCTSRSAEAFRYAPALLCAKGRGARFAYQHAAPNGAMKAENGWRRKKSIKNTFVQRNSTNILQT